MACKTKNNFKGRGREEAGIVCTNIVDRDQGFSTYTMLPVIPLKPDLERLLFVVTEKRITLSVKASEGKQTNSGNFIKKAKNK